MFASFNAFWESYRPNYYDYIFYGMFTHFKLLLLKTLWQVSKSEKEILICDWIVIE